MTRPALGIAAGLFVLAATVAACSRSQPQSAAAPPAPAPAPPAAQPQFTGGKVQSASATELTIVSQNGPVSFQLTPATQIMVTHTGTVADIKPGSFLGTTNVPSADGTGQSTEVHVFPPGVKMGEGDRPMGPPPSDGSTVAVSRMTNGAVSAVAPAQDASTPRMTNGSVGAVANGTGGVEMDVAYAGGKRHIVVPAKTPVMVLTSGTTALLKPGVNVLVGAVPGQGGSSEASFINIQP